ncbi:MAG: hypothetical protein HZA92_08105 [Verrucomicrobia bacterium]|nr:hypothetical protein [Verrucomicrobiota bacterium]
MKRTDCAGATLHVHNGNDALAHGGEIPFLNLEHASFRKMNDERGEGAIEPFTRRVEIQHETTLMQQPDRLKPRFGHPQLLAAEWLFPASSQGDER